MFTMFINKLAYKKIPISTYIYDGFLEIGTVKTILSRFSKLSTVYILV